MVKVLFTEGFEFPGVKYKLLIKKNGEERVNKNLLDIWSRKESDENWSFKKKKIFLNDYTAIFINDEIVLKDNVVSTAEKQ